MLKKNSKDTLDIIAGQTKRNATAAYKETHPTATQKTAQAAVNKLLAKPEAQVYLQEHITKASNRIVELVDNEKPDIALRASQDVLDRSHGKAIQQVNQTTTGVTLVIDLTSSLAAQTN
jgi:hypothetical protein